MTESNISRVLRCSLAALLVAGLLGQTGCISGDTPAQQRATMLKTRDETIETLYVRNPETKITIKNAAGYVALKGFSLHPGLMSFASGSMVIVDNATGKPVFDRMFRFGVGPGLAIKSHRVVVLVNSREALQRIIDEPWIFAGLLEASFKFGDFGGSAGLSTSFGDDVTTYYWTDTGFSIEAAVGVMKTWHDEDINSAK